MADTRDDMGTKAGSPWEKPEVMKQTPCQLQNSSQIQAKAQDKTEGMPIANHSQDGKVGQDQAWKGKREGQIFYSRMTPKCFFLAASPNLLCKNSVFLSKIKRKDLFSLS